MMCVSSNFSQYPQTYPTGKIAHDSIRPINDGKNSDNLVDFCCGKQGQTNRLSYYNISKDFFHVPSLSPV